MPLYPSNALGARRRARSPAGTSSGSGCGRTRSTCPGRSSTGSRRPARGTASTCVDRRQRARARAARDRSTTRCSLIGPEGAPAQAPQADADPARAALPRHRRGRRPQVVETPARPHRRADLLGEPDAAGALRASTAAAADLGRARPPTTPTAGSRIDAPHRDRVGRVRRLGAAVHPALRRSPTTSRCRCRARATSSAAAAPRSSTRRGRGDRRARSTTRRGSSSPTATSAPGCTPSAGSTPSGTTAARTCCSGSTAPTHHHLATTERPAVPRVSTATGWR